MECSICGISGKMRNVSDALSPTGIVLACDRCIRNEGFIALKRPRIAVQEEEKGGSVYERLSRLAGIKPKEQQRPLRFSQEKDLKELVNQNYEKKIKQETILKQRPDLVDNFHWIIMRIRRVKGLTQSQLAERINEPEAAVRMAEQGVVPEDYKLLEKLEKFLKVRLIKERKNPVKTGTKSLFFERNDLDSMTIADLKKMKESSEILREEKKDYEQTHAYDRLDYE